MTRTPPFPSTPRPRDRLVRGSHQPVERTPCGRAPTDVAQLDDCHAEASELVLGRELGSFQHGEEDGMRARGWFLASTVMALVIVSFAWLQAPPSTAQTGTPTIQATATRGTTAESFTVTGTGCDGGGVITFSVDGGGGTLLYSAPDGTWSYTMHFPLTVGPHTITFRCRDKQTAGSPSTIVQPGAVRFAYEPVVVETTRYVAPQPAGPSTAPTPAAPRPAAPASPAPGAANYTG
jgi:hypothetical protein